MTTVTTKPPVTNTGTTINQNPELARIKKILTTILGVPVADNNISLASGKIYAVKIQSQNKNISFNFDSTNNTVSGLLIDSMPKMRFTDTFLITSLRNIISQIGTYETHISKLSTELKLGKIDIVNIDYTQKRILIGSKFYPLP